MEADSTTYDNSPKADISEPALPFHSCPSNFRLYKDFSSNNDARSLELQIVERMQDFGLLPKSIKCSTGNFDCKVVRKTARVVDRVQWVCEGCGKKQPIRTGSFFLKLQCSILQALQIILAWCEDADCDAAAEYFGVKPRIATLIYDRLNAAAFEEQIKLKLGGEGAVVLAEMYPDCLTRLSPDTTDQPHVHRILMVADTNLIPTSYQLHVIKEYLKKNFNSSSENQSLTAEVENLISQVTVPDSIVVTGSNMPALDGGSTVQQLVQHCDADMQHFLSSRIWRQAITLCAASRDLCAGGGVPSAACAGAVQLYLNTALYRLRHGDGFYEHVLRLIAAEHTEQYDDDITCNDVNCNGNITSNDI